MISQIVHRTQKQGGKMTFLQVLYDKYKRAYTQVSTRYFRLNVVSLLQLYKATTSSPSLTSTFITGNGRPAVADISVAALKCEARCYNHKTNNFQQQQPLVLAIYCCQHNCATFSKLIASRRG